MFVSTINLYPLKSAAAVPVAQAQVEPRGLAGDRRWMVVDASGRFLTGRQLPQMTLIRAEVGNGRLRLNGPNMPELIVSEPTNVSTLPVVVWKHRVDALPVDAANDWLRAFLGVDAHLVFMGPQAQRQMDLSYANQGDLVSFADSCPVMLISQAALDGLNQRLATPVSMLRFRPNLVIDGAEPHAEDHWRRIRIGVVEFDVVRDCTRCVFVTVDPDSGRRDESGEPLATLKQYRRFDHGITFGRHLIPRSEGRIAAGDTLTVLD